MHVMKSTINYNKLCKYKSSCKYLNRAIHKINVRNNFCSECSVVFQKVRTTFLCFYHSPLHGCMCYDATIPSLTVDLRVTKVKFTMHWFDETCWPLNVYCKVFFFSWPAFTGSFPVFYLRKISTSLFYNRDKNSDAQADTAILNSFVTVRSKAHNKSQIESIHVLSGSFVQTRPRSEYSGKSI